MPFKDYLNQNWEEIRYERIVSLVPSITEALFEFGLGDKVIGVTKFCIYPPEARRYPREVCGGTKNPDIDKIVSLHPDLIITNFEENRKKDVEKFLSLDIPVWVTYPRTVDEGLQLLFQITEVLGLSANTAIIAQIKQWEEKVQSISAITTSRGFKRKKVFCPIWKNPWMSINNDTFLHDVLKLAGLDNITADYTFARYPKVDLKEILLKEPDLILLPDEPYQFNSEDIHELQSLTEILYISPIEKISIFDGTISWYGIRIANSLEKIYHCAFN